MKKLEVSRATRSVGKYAEEVSKEPLIITEDGRPLAALQRVRTIDMARATDSLGRLARTVYHSPLVLTVDGKPVATLMSLAGSDMESVSLATNPDFVALLERSRARHKAEGGLSPEELRRRLGIKPKRKQGRHPQS